MSILRSLTYVLYELKINYTITTCIQIYAFLLVKNDFKRCTYFQIYTLVIYNVGVIEKKNSAECTSVSW